MEIEYKVIIKHKKPVERTMLILELKKRKFNANIINGELIVKFKSHMLPDFKKVTNYFGFKVTHFRNG